MTEIDNNMNQNGENLTEKIAKYLEARQAELRRYIENFNRQTTEDIETGAFLDDNHQKPGYANGNYQRFSPSDPLVRKAVEVCLDKGKFSTAILQTYLGKSHAYVARLAIWLEEIGAIGPVNGNKPRDLLINSMDEFDEKTAKTIYKSAPIRYN